MRVTTDYSVSCEGLQVSLSNHRKKGWKKWKIFLPATSEKDNQGCCSVEKFLGGQKSEIPFFVRFMCMTLNAQFWWITLGHEQLL